MEYLYLLQKQFKDFHNFTFKIIAIYIIRKLEEGKSGIFFSLFREHCISFCNQIHINKTLHI
jgi:hypothetical protein